MDDLPDKPAADVSSREIKPPNAWQPFTPKGVAAFAQASLGRLVILEIIVALIAAAAVIWLVGADYFPATREAIQKMPDAALLENGTLTNVASGALSDQKFLSIAIDLEETGQFGKTADLQLQLRPKYFQVCSLLGCVVFDYPKETILLGRSTVEPWWGARQPVIFGIIGLAGFIGLMLSWFLFAMVYAPIVKLIAYFSDRELSWSGSWKLASAAQMFAALLMTFAIVLYGLNAFDLIRFLFFFSAHFLVAWIYAGCAPFFLPRVSAKIPIATNPFS